MIHIFGREEMEKEMRKGGREREGAGVCRGGQTKQYQGMLHLEVTPWRVCQTFYLCIYPSMYLCIYLSVSHLSLALSHHLYHIASIIIYLYHLSIMSIIYLYLSSLSSLSFAIISLSLSLVTSACHLDLSSLSFLLSIYLYLKQQDLPSLAVFFPKGHCKQ